MDKEKAKQTKNSFGLIIVILLIALVVTTLNIRMIFNVTSRQTEELGTLQMNGIRAELQSTLDAARQDALIVSSEVGLILQRNESTEVLEYYLRTKKDNFSESSCINVYAAGPDWHVIPDFEEPEDFDPAAREWYIGAVQEAGRVYISQPYMDLASDNVCFTVARYLEEADAVVSLDYNLLKVQDYIKAMSEGGRAALIVTEDGRIAGYNDTTQLGKSLADVLPEYVDILELEKNNKNLVVLPQTIDGVKQTVFCSKTENNWYLILCVNTAELYKSSYQQMAWLTLVNAGLILTIVSLYMLSLRNRRKAERALRVREEFLAGMSTELRSPLSAIINNSNPDLNIPAQEGMERIRESALRLSDMVDNLLSYSNIVTTTEKQKKRENDEFHFTGMNKRIRSAIIGIILFTMIISAVIFSASNLRLGNQQLQQESDHYEYALSQWIVEQKSILSMFCNMITANPEILNDYDRCIQFLDDITRNYKDISVVYMTNPEAEHTVMMNNGWQPEEGWYVEERQWYIDTINSQTGFNISSPYFDEQTGLYCVTFSQRVYDKNGRFLGNFGIDFYMDKLIDILGESYTDTGYAFLVDADGSIINHPYAYYQMTQSTSSNILDKNYKNAYANRGAITRIKDYDNATKACIAVQNTDSNFTVVVVRNWWSIYGSIILVCSLFVLLFGICVYAVYYLISRLMKWQVSVNEQLQEAVDSATAAGKAKSQFLAQMSHEIRTPINAVLGMNEMIIRESSENSIKEYAADIQSAGRTLLSLINSILDFSKIEDGKMEIVNIEYDTSSMINDLVNMISERAAKKNLELKLDIDPNLPMTLYGDDMRIRQVITNLLTNAVKYTESGSVTLKMSGNLLEGNRLALNVSVTDTGIGIRDEDKDMLCQSFQRLDQERNHNIEGTGLGLSIVSKLLAMMDSDLKIDSVYGEGSTFYFSVEQGIVTAEPIGDYSKHHAEAMKSMDGSAFLYAPTAQILIVDDNEMNLKVARNLMKRNGIIPETVTSGMQCISAVENKKYDIIFLDHMMPGMDGIETLHQLKHKNLVDEDSVIIALTANAISGAKEMYMEEGFRDYLSKPIDVNRLEQKLVKYLPEEKISYKSTEEKKPMPEEKPGEETTAKEALPETPAAEVPAAEEETGGGLINYELGMGYCANDPEFYREVAEAYLEEADEKLEKLDGFYEAQDWKNYAIIAHAIKSTSLTIGAESLSTLAKEHEFAGKEERAEDIDASYVDFLELYQNVLMELKAKLETME